MVGPIDVKQKWIESTGCYADLDIFDLGLWPWIFKVKLYLGNGRPDCHGTKGTRVDRMPWCETLRKWVNWTLRWLVYIWPLPLTLNFQDLIVSRNGRPDCHHGTKGAGADRIPWCETLRIWVNRTLHWLGYLWPLPLTLNFQGQIVSRE